MCSRLCYGAFGHRFLYSSAACFGALLLGHSLLCKTCRLVFWWVGGCSASQCGPEEVSLSPTLPSSAWSWGRMGMVLGWGPSLQPGAHCMPVTHCVPHSQAAARRVGAAPSPPGAVSPTASPAPLADVCLPWFFVCWSARSAAALPTSFRVGGHKNCWQWQWSSPEADSDPD